MELDTVFQIRCCDCGGCVTAIELESHWECERGEDVANFIIMFACTG